MTETDEIFTAKDILDGHRHPTLGPVYFAARRICETAMAEFEAEHLKPLVEAFKKEVETQLWESIHDSIWSDTEMNLQGTMWRMVDEIVRCILSDNRPWISQQYALGERYDCEAIRKTLALSIKDELASAFHADLQVENEKLRKDLEWERRHR